MVVSGGPGDESVDYRRKCQICQGAQAEAGCFFCRARSCLQCLRPAPGVLPMCLVCAGEMGSAETRPVEWAQKMEYAVETMMASILALQNQTTDHETILQQLVKNNPAAVEPEQEICEITPTESPSEILVEVEESPGMVNTGPVRPPPVEDPLEVFTDSKQE